MRTRLLKTIRKKSCIPLLMLSITCMIFILPHQSFSQKKQLTPSDKVTRIGYLDHSALRKEYKAYHAAKEKLAKEHAAEKKTYEESLKLLDKQTAQKLKKDSLSGGKNRQQLLNESETKRQQLARSYQAQLKKRNEEKLNISKEYEKKIILAIEAVVNEGGFTDIKPLSKDSSSVNGLNVTDLVLKKLN